MSHVLWRNRNFVLLFSAQTVSNVGDWLNILAILVLVGMRWHSSAYAISGVMLCMALPMTLLGPFTGALADRMNRKLLMIASNVLSGLLVLFVVFVHTVWQLYIVLILLSAVESCFVPAQSAKLRESVADNQLSRAISLSSAIAQIAKIVGPSLSGILIAAFGPMSAFYVDSGTFFLSAALLLFLSRSSFETEQSESCDETAPSFSLIDGFRHITETRILLVGVSAFTLFLLTMQLVESQSVTLFRNIPHVSVHIFGLSVACSGFGMFLTSLALSRFSFYRITPFLSLGSIGLATAYVLVGVSHYFGVPTANWLLPISFFIAGVCFGGILIPFEIMAQRVTPEQFTGRVFGIINSASTAATIIGPIVGAVLVSAYGVSHTFVFAGAVLGCLGFTMLSLVKWIEPRREYVTENIPGA